MKRNKVMLLSQSLKRVIRLFRKSLSNPILACQSSAALARGTFYILYYKLTRRSVKIKYPFYAYYSVTIRGPGTVRIGRNCHVYPNLREGLRILTTSKESQVLIGNNCALGGAKIRCSGTVIIQDDVMTANVLIQDSWFFRCADDQKGNIVFVRVRPIFIGRNSWLSLRSCVLGGSVIKADSVVAAGAVTWEYEGKDYSLLSGNPVELSIPIERMKKLLK